MQVYAMLPQIEIKNSDKVLCDFIVEVNKGQLDGYSGADLDSSSTNVINF